MYCSCYESKKETKEIIWGPIVKCKECNRFLRWAEEPGKKQGLPYFLAICDDNPDHPQGLTFSVYFVNNTDRDIPLLRLGFFEIQSGETATDGYSSGLTGHEWKDVKARSFVKIDEDNETGFDYTGCFDIQVVERDGPACKLRFVRPRIFWGEEDIPVLRKKGQQMSPSEF